MIVVESEPGVIVWCGGRDGIRNQDWLCGVVGSEKD